MLHINIFSIFDYIFYSIEDGVLTVKTVMAYAYN